MIIFVDESCWVNDPSFFFLFFNLFFLYAGGTPNCVTKHTTRLKILFLLIVNMTKCNLVKMHQILVCDFQAIADVLLEDVHQ